jgi:hypothetical protein
MLFGTLSYNVSSVLWTKICNNNNRKVDKNHLAKYSLGSEFLH